MESSGRLSHGRSELCQPAQQARQTNWARREAKSEAHIAPALLALCLNVTGESARTSSGPSIPLRACNRTLRPTARGNGIRVGHRKGHSFGTDLKSRAAAHVNANGEAWLGPAQGTFSYRRAKPSPSDHIRPRVDPGGQVQ
jgi:hypothetical protein